MSKPTVSFEDMVQEPSWRTASHSLRESDDAGPEIESIIVPGRDSPGEDDESQEAIWWPADGPEPETLLHAEVDDLGVFVWRMVISPTILLEYKWGAGNWQESRAFGDTMVNRITLGRYSAFLLRIEGQSSSGVALDIRGHYRMNGQTYTFGPGGLGTALVVQIPNLCTCNDPLQIFTFTVIGRDQANNDYEYDPRMFITPKPGQCKTT